MRINNAYTILFKLAKHKHTHTFIRIINSLIKIREGKEIWWKASNENKIFFVYLYTVLLLIMYMH